MIAPFLLCVFAACFSKFVYGKLRKECNLLELSVG